MVSLLASTNFRIPTPPNSYKISIVCERLSAGTYSWRGKKWSPSFFHSSTYWKNCAPDEYVDQSRVSFSRIHATRIPFSTSTNGSLEEGTHDLSVPLYSNTHSGPSILEIMTIPTELDGWNASLRYEPNNENSVEFFASSLSPAHMINLTLRCRCTWQLFGGVECKIVESHCEKC